jgi:PAS domain S-box-containing protein
VIHSYHQGLAWTDEEHRGLVATLGPVELYAEYLDALRFPQDAAAEAATADRLAAKYRGRPPDVLVVTDNPAWDLALRHRDRFAAGRPVVYAGVNELLPADVAHLADFTGVTERASFAETLALVRSWLPGVRRLVVLGDPTPTFQANLAGLRRAHDGLGAPFQLEVVQRATLPELEREVAALRATDAVFLMARPRAADGGLVPEAEVARRIGAASRPPIFSCWAFFLGHGIVGGHLVSGESHGRVAGELVNRLLAGEPVSSLPRLLESPNQYAFDHRELAQHGLLGRTLPPGALVLNQPARLWDTHRGWVVGVTVAIVSLGLLVGLLAATVGLRRRAQDALAARERHFRSYFESAMVGMAATSPEKGWLEVNPALCQILGRPAEELKRRTWAEITHPDDLAADVAEFERLLRGEAEEYGLEKRFLRPDGAVVQARIAARCVRREDGTPDYFVAMVEDITERRRAEEAVRSSEQMLRFVLDNFPGVVYWKNRQGVYLGCNRNSAAAAGLARPEDIVGKTDYDLPWGRTQGDAYRADDQQVIASGRGREGIVEPQLRASGEVAWLATTKVPLRAAGGEIIGVLGASHDITGWKRAEEALRRSQERLALATAAGRIGTWEWEVASGELFWSDEVEAIFGYGRGEFPRAYGPYLERIHPDDRAGLLKAIDEALAQGAPYAVEHRIVRPDGAVRWVSASGTVMRDGDGRPQRMVGVVQDVTGRREQEEALRRSLAEKEVLLREVHHRVKNNLQVVSSMLSIQARRAVAAGAGQVLEDARQRIRSMALVHETLYRSGDLARVDLPEYLRAVVRGLQRGYAPEGGRVRVVDDLAAVSVDADRAIPCGLIVNELVSNAFRHAFPGAEGGEVRLVLRRDPEGPVELSVSDDGPGLPHGAEGGEGPTLGLRIVRLLAEQQLRGSLRVEREGGTRFTVRFDP